MRILACFLFIFTVALTCNAQLNLTQSPKSEAFIPQNRFTQSAKLELKGEVTTGGYQKINIKIFRNGTLNANYLQSLSYIGGKAKFSQNIELETGKYLYNIKYELSGGNNYNYEVKNLIVGDVYLIQGQSNAVASFNSPIDPKYKDPYLRSFGTSHPNPNACLTDTSWHEIEAGLVYSSGSVGQWAAVMAKHLLDSFNTPICLLNGALGGTRIDQHQPNTANLEDLFTIYGRLLYRVRKAHLDSSISGILYFQGESDGWNAVKHDTGFTNLYNHWKRDYPGFKKLYVVQVRDGCGNPTLQLREVQRQFEFKLPNCQTVSANGLNNHDNCHYGFVNGYEKLGQQLSKLVARDFYWPNEITNINPPNINYAYYSDGKQQEITLVMQSTSDLVFVDNYFETLFQIEGDLTVQVKAGRIEKNKVILTLNKSSCNITGLSYNGKRGNQPWVKSKTGMGLISFYNIPIKNHNVSKDQFVCKNKVAKIGTPALPNVKYTIEQLSTGIKTFQSYKGISLQADDSFKLTITFDSLPCPKKDSIIIYISVDDVVLPKLPQDTILCAGDSLILAPNSYNYKTFNWIQNNKAVSSFEYQTIAPGEIHLLALSNKGCIYNDDFLVSTQQPIIPIDSIYSKCATDSLKILLTDTFNSYTWDNISGNASNTYTNEGLHELIVTDAYGCTQSKSFAINHFKKTEYTGWDTLICYNATVKTSKPNHVKEWFKNNGTIGKHFYTQGKNSVPLMIIDTNNCHQLDTINITTFNKKDFPSTIDTVICNNEVVTVALPENMKSYGFRGKSLENNIIKESGLGTYPYSAIDSNHCAYEGELNIAQAPIPSLDFINDTVLCIFDSLTIMLNSANSYFINSNLVKGSFTFKPDAQYIISSENIWNCSNTKLVYIGSKKCTNGLNGFNQFKIYPNPFKNKLFIQFLEGKAKSLVLYNSSGQVIINKTVKVPNLEQIDLTSYPSGFYYLLIDSRYMKLQKL